MAQVRRIISQLLTECISTDNWLANKKKKKYFGGQFVKGKLFLDFFILIIHLSPFSTTDAAGEFCQEF